MFSLMKLTFKTKVIFVSIIIIIVSMGIVYIRNTTPITVTLIDNWVFVTSSNEGSWYYKSNTIYKDEEINILNVWVKIVYTDKGKQDFLKSHKEDKYNDIIKSLSLVSINYQKETYEVNRVVYYSKSDDIIRSDELSKKISDFIPKSVGDKLLFKILKDYDIKK